MMTTSQQQLIAALIVEKNLGKTPQQAVIAISTSALAASPSRNLMKFNLATVGASPLATALSVVYPQGITPLEMGIILKGVGFNVPDIAAALHSVYDKDLDALSCGHVLLHKEMYPQLARSGLITALTSANYSAQDSELAANILYPISMQVAANIAWQNTGLNVTGTQNTLIKYISGEWTFNTQLPPCDANGNRRLIAKPYYTLPGAPEGALICKVGDKVLLAGDQFTLPTGLAGNLQLCINDDLESRYGTGLIDNTGSLLVTITTAAR